MPYYQSPALYIDFSRLPPPTVIETIDKEALLAVYKANVLAANPALAAALNLEQSPTNIILEAEAYGEMIMRARVNAAARACMLAFSTGSDLDALGALFNVQRNSVTTTVNGISTTTYEDDDRFRSQIQLAPEAFTTAGSAGAYIWQAKDSDMTIRDASPSVTGPGRILVAIMNSDPQNPAATDAQITNVRNRLTDPAIKPLTDDVSVVSVNVLPADIKATITLYPGPDAALVMASITSALTSLRNRISLIGRDLTRSAIIAALNQEGVQNVNLISPAADVVADDLSCVFIRSASIDPNGVRTE